MFGVKIGTIFGVDIRVDFSWFIIFFLILWSFTSAVYPRSAPGLGAGTYFVMGLCGTLLFFGSLIAHELSHAIVARRRGIPIEGITLFIFGGMAITGSEAKSAGDEFKIAGIGPLLSISVALLFALLQYVGLRAGWPAAVVAVLHYTMVLNLMLAVFNLLPGMPLDGGRILRAIVWKVSGNAERAARVAAAAGRGLAFLLIGFGLLQAFFGNVVGGLWLVFIGWFLQNAAVSSYRQHVVLAALDGVRARDTMTLAPETVERGLTLAGAMSEYFMRRRHMVYPVLDSGQPIGVVTFAQVRDVPQEQWTHMAVEDVMTPLTDDVVVQADEPMVAVLDRMRRSPIRRVLVMRNQRLEGIITAHDVASWLERERRPGTR